MSVVATDNGRYRSFDDVHNVFFASWKVKCDSKVPTLCVLSGAVSVSGRDNCRKEENLIVLLMDFNGWTVNAAVLNEACAASSSQ